MAAKVRPQAQVSQHPASDCGQQQRLSKAYKDTFLKYQFTIFRLPEWELVSWYLITFRGFFFHQFLYSFLDLQLLCLQVFSRKENRLICICKWDFHLCKSINFFHKDLKMWHPLFIAIANPEWSYHYFLWHSTKWRASQTLKNLLWNIWGR